MKKLFCAALCILCFFLCTASAALAVGTDTLDPNNPDSNDTIGRNTTQSSGSTADSYDRKTFEWIDRDAGTGKVTIVSKREEVEEPEETRAVLAFTSCTAHALTKEVMVKNILYLLEYYDHVDLITSQSNTYTDNESSIIIKEVQSLNLTTANDVNAFFDDNGIVFDKNRHYTTPLYGALCNYLSEETPNVIYVSFDRTYYSTGTFASTAEELANYNCWDTLKEYDARGAYISLACEEPEDLTSSVNKRIAATKNAYRSNSLTLTSVNETISRGLLDPSKFISWTSAAAGAYPDYLYREDFYALNMPAYESQKIDRITDKTSNAFRITSVETNDPSSVITISEDKREVTATFPSKAAGDEVITTVYVQLTDNSETTVENRNGWFDTNDSCTVYGADKNGDPNIATIPSPIAYNDKTFVVYNVTYDPGAYGSTSLNVEEVRDGENPEGATITPNTGYVHKGWTCNKDVVLNDGSTVKAGTALTNDQIKTIKVTEAIRLTAFYDFTVTYKGGSYGVLTGISSEILVEGENPSGSSVEANSGYVNTGWLCNQKVQFNDGTEASALSLLTSEQVKTIKVTSPLIITADYAIIVNYSAGSNGTLSGKSSENVVYNGQPKGSSVTAKEGYVHIGWTADQSVPLLDGGNINSGVVMTDAQVVLIRVRVPITLTAAYSMKVTYSAGDGGILSGIASEVVASGGSPSGSSVAPNDGHVYAGWTCDKDVTLTDGTAITPGKVLTDEQVKAIRITDAITLTAAYDVHVTYSAGENGTLTGIASEEIVSGGNPSGSSVAPDEGYVATGWTCDKDVILADGTTVPAGTLLMDGQVPTIRVMDPIVLTAAYDVKVTYSAGENGTLTGISNETVARGGSPSGSQVTPNEGFSHTGWVCDRDVMLADGTVVVAGDILTVTQVQAIRIAEPVVLTAAYDAIQALPATGDKNSPGLWLVLLCISAAGMTGTVLCGRKNKIRPKRIGR